MSVYEVRNKLVCFPEKNILKFSYDILIIYYTNQLTNYFLVYEISEN